MIEAVNLTKTYGSTTAVDGVSFAVAPGKVTGFLGPNGAGKSTTMRMILGLDKPTSGSVTVDGKRYAQHAAPMSVIGALIDAKGVHPKRSARSHLRALAATHGIPSRRVDEVLELTGLTSVARKRAGQFSLGMGQRLGIAAALLADPQVVMLDEPVNGLDPDGVLWVRQVARNLADGGRTVFLSSHLMSEVQQTADHVIVIGRGRILADAPIDQFVASQSRQAVTVVSPDAERLIPMLRDAGAGIEPGKEPDRFSVEGLSTLAIATVARDNRLLVTGLADQTSTLEEAYMRLTADAVEYQSATAGAVADKENA